LNFFRQQVKPNNLNNKSVIRDKKYHLLAKSSTGSGIYQSVLREDTGWQFLNFQARLMVRGEQWSGNTGENEYAIILLGGNYSVKTDKGNWETVNGRKDVFSGIAHSLYLPRNTEFDIDGRK
jgi:5-deoxy-glucuronate isomerase